MSSPPVVAAAPAGMHRPFLLPAISLCRRELVRFVRQRSRIVGALATPLVFWLLIGGGMGRSLNVGGNSSYIQYFFPGTLLMILLFTAIFSTISVIEDRREGFMQSVLIAPVSRHAVVLGKVLGGTLLAAGQGLLFLLLAPAVGIGFTVGSASLCVLFMLILSFALTSLGLAIAWRMSSTQGFHAIMNLFLMPLWFLSGALFPAQGAWPVLRWAIAVNPLSYGLAGLRGAMGLVADGDVPSASLAVNLPVSLALAIFLFILAGLVASRPSQADLS